MKEPLILRPVYQERVWGGRELERRFGRALPVPDTPFGESWEVCDRPEAQTEVVIPLALAGETLGGLWGDPDRRATVFGEAYVDRSGPFPLLVKILDARERLSIQVHPPAAVADELGGEPKTEMWYIAAAEPGAELYVGLREGVTREDFERGIEAGETESQVHRLPAAAGDFIFIPSGRLHAIGAGLLIYEIQQNSDTTYRVFDWNRVGLDGQPRELHVAESLRCIDFDDVEPGMTERDGELLVDCPEFRVEEWELPQGTSRDAAPDGRFAIMTIVDGLLVCGGMEFRAGDFFLVPASAADDVRALVPRESGATVLRTTLP